MLVFFVCFFFREPPPRPELSKCPRALPRAALEEAWRESPPGEGRAASGPPSWAGGSAGVSPSHTLHVCLI